MVFSLFLTAIRSRMLILASPVTSAKMLSPLVTAWFSLLRTKIEFRLAFLNLPVA